MYTDGLGKESLAWHYPFLLPDLTSLPISFDADLHMRAYAQQQFVLQRLMLIRNLNPRAQLPPVLPTAPNHAGKILFNEWAVDSALYNSIIPLLRICTVPHAQPQHVPMWAVGKFRCFQFIRIV